MNENQRQTASMLDLPAAAPHRPIKSDLSDKQNDIHWLDDSIVTVAVSPRRSRSTSPLLHF